MICADRRAKPCLYNSPFDLFSSKCILGMKKVFQWLSPISVFFSLDVYSTNYLTTYLHQQLLLFGEIVLAQKVMYEKLGSDFIIHFVSKGLQAAHCPHELTEQYYQKLQVQELC